jgi:hypothetical protein
MTQLIRYEQARNALAECHRVDEVKDIRDKAEAMAAYARQAKDQELILWATEIKVRAERRAGEMLAHMEKSTGSKFNGRNEDGSVRRSHDDTAKTLADVGVTKVQSSRWQQLASMTPEHFEATVATAKDTAGQVTTAFMLREAAKHKPRHNKRLTQADKGRLEQLDQARGASMLVAYSRMVLKAMREAESLTEQERTTLAQLRDEINRALAPH